MTSFYFVDMTAGKLAFIRYGFIFYPHPFFIAELSGRDNYGRGIGLVNRIRGILNSNQK
jgi:hypothetical protein